ncbi:MAG: copper-binding protein, partial [Amphiplicatus sp.]
MNRQTSTLAVAVVGALIISSALAAEPEATMPRPMGQGMNPEMNHACGLPMGDGVIKSMDVGESKVSIAYEPIKALDWDNGTKKFAVTRPV